MENSYLITYLKKSVLTSIGKTFIVSVLTLVFIPLIIKNIGMEQYGVITLTLLFGPASTFIDLGTSKSVTLLIGKEKKNENIIMGSVLSINIMLIFVAALILIFVISGDFKLFGDNFNINQNLKNHILIVGFLVMVTTLVNSQFSAIMEAKYLIHFINIGSSISSFTLYGYIYLFTLLTQSISILLLAPLLSMLTLFCYNLYIIKRFTSIGICMPNKYYVKKILSTSFRFLNIALINSMIIPINKYLLVYITGNTSFLGIFDLCLKITMIANSLLNSLSIPLFGVFSNFEENDYKKIFHIALNTSGIIFFGYILGNGIFYLFGTEITSLIDIEHSKIIANVSMICLVGICSTAIAEPFYRALLGMGRLKEAFYIKLLIPIMNVLLYLSFSGQSNYLIRLSMAMSIAFLFSSCISIIYYLITYHLRVP